MRTEWPAYYLDGRSAARRPATVRLMPSGLHIAVDGGPTLWWPFREVRQTQGFYAGEQVRLERGGEIAEAIVVDDVEFLGALQRIGPGFTGHLDSPARRRRRLRLTVLAGLGAVPLAIALYVWGIPAAAGIAATWVPVAWEESLGDMVVAQLAPAERRCVDADLQRVLDDMLTTLTARLPPHGYTLRVQVTNDRRVNAFAAPGGHIVLLRGLLERTESAEELAGVLAHEAQHILRRHTTRALLQHASTGILIAAVAGDVTGIAAFGLEAARTLGTLRYSRVNEEDADREGMRMLIAAGVDGRGMLTFFESLARREPSPGAGGVTRYLVSHPSTVERIEKLRALAAQQPPVTRRLVPDQDWREVRRMCEGGPPR